MAALFWLSDRQRAAIQPLLPTNQPGAHRVDDRRVISGIIHVPRIGCRWQDTPSAYGPPTTIYNRFHRWSQRSIWQGWFAGLAEVTPGGIHSIDSTTAEAQRAACGGKGEGAAAQALGRSRGEPGTKIHAVADAQGRMVAFTITSGQLGDARAAHGLLGPLPPAGQCLADGAYDSNGLRAFLLARGTQPVIPNNPTRKHLHAFD